MKGSNLFILLVFVLCSCGISQKEQAAGVSSNKYAHGFEIVKEGEITRLTITNPWEQAENVIIDYYLVDKGKEVPDSLEGKSIIFTPVERIICLSTSHIAFLDALGVADKVVGVSGSKYITNEEVVNRIANGEVVDVGYGQNLNYELIVKQTPSLVMVYGIGSEVSSVVRKLHDLGVPAILNAEYLESSPLGKAEWIKFVGELFNKSQEAEQFMLEVEEDYNQLKQLVHAIGKKPNVLVGSPYKDSWWVPGGDSYMANLISDAGGDYVGKDNPSHESYVVSFENALTWAANADVWINMGMMASKKEILASDERFKNLVVFNEGRVFNNINRVSANGGNDFWESGAIYPNLILKDLIKILYPNILVEEEYTYYKEIK